MNESQERYRLSKELPDDENEPEEIRDDHPSQQEIHAPGWYWEEDDEDEEDGEITRVFIPISR